MLNALASFVLGGSLVTQTPIAPTTPTAADFFPLSTGTLRTYTHVGGTTTEEVLAAITVGGKTVYPVVGRAGTRMTGTAFYQVDPNAVYLLGYDDQKNWLTPPLPIVEFDGRAGKWTYNGTTGGKSPQPIVMEGQSRTTRIEDVFGKSVPILEVTLKATYGGEVNVQTAKYALGIGMIEIVSSVEGGKSHTKLVPRRLIKIEGAKSNG